MTWIKKFDYVRARSFEDVLGFWSQRSPVGIEIGQGRLAEHIEYLAEELPKDGARYIGPIESRTVMSELYCGVAKAFNLSFHAQTLARNQAYTNGSLHSFNSLVQFMLAVMSIFGVFVIRIGGKYFVLDMFPWLGYLKGDRELRKQFGPDWWRYGRVIADSKETIEQGEIVALFQRCLRMTTAVGWQETFVTQLVDCEPRWFNRPRNNILYNFTGWTGSPDLIVALDADVSSLLRVAARSIFDYDAQMAFGSLPQSLLLGSLATHVWTKFRTSVSMELSGQLAPEFPAVGDPTLIGLIGEFEAALNVLLSESV